MEWAARQIDAVTRQDSPILAQWQAIQDELRDMPPDALRDLFLDFVRTVVVLDESDSDPDENPLLDLIEQWYRRALFVRAERERPSGPIDRWPQVPASV